ncbi:MAG: TonB-dependent receptor domain-containing protein, partial [Burkholderiales bacterium]
MKNSFKLGLASLAVFNCAYAGDLPTFRLSDVVVTASRTPQTIGSSLADISVISSEDIARAGQSTLAELLQSQPGVDIVSNGGMGTATSISLRGADSTHTLVLLDGMRIDSATLGTASLENIPLNLIDHIEILRGPASHLYGSEAIGGVIQIFTKSGAGKPRSNFSVGYGSYNTRKLSGGLSGETDGTRFSLQAGQTESDSISAYSSGNPGYLDKNRDSDAYRNTNVSAKLARTLAEGQEIGLDVFGSNGRSHYDGSSSNVDYYNDHALSAIGLYSKNRVTSDWHSTVRVSQSGDHYNDFAAAKTVFNTDQNQFSWQNDIKLGAGQALLGMEYLEQKVGGTTRYAVDARRVKSFFAGYQARFGLHSVQANVRQDDNSQFGAHDTGYLGYGYRFAPQWRATGSISTAFKAPTFSDLYYPGSGNLDLRPETSLNKEIGVHYDQGVHHLSAVYFDNRVSDLIAWAPIPPDFKIWKPANVNKASLTGTSLSYQGQLGGYGVRASLDHQNPEDQA